MLSLHHIYAQQRSTQRRLSREEFAEPAEREGAVAIICSQIGPSESDRRHTRTWPFALNVDSTPAHLGPGAAAWGQIQKSEYKA
jgi:hypothetical protein